MTSFKLRVMAQVLPFLLIAPGLTVAQAQKPPSRGEAMAAMKATPQKASAQYTRQQIDQLIAPIALYPDQLLAQVLMAATYPQQLLDAADWLQDAQHAGLQGDELAQALEPLPWDPSVKALVAFPPIIAMMTEHLEWTEALGLAFATQQAQVMQRVQGLRQLAVKSGRIRNVKHVTVRQDANVITIVSAEPDRVFVPVYNPTVVYGQWPDRDYPPIYVMPPRRFATGPRETVVETIEPGFEVYSYPVVAPLWGWTRPDWRSNQITIQTDEYTRITRDVRPPPNDRWRREGPIVIVNRPEGRAANRASGPVPAGTIAPAQAAAVTALPQRAARQPDKVRIEQAAAPSGAGASGANPAANRSPSELQGGQAGQAQAEKAQADKAQAGKAQADKAQADKAQADKAQADKAQADKAQADKAQADKAQADKAQADRAQADKAQADKAQADRAQADKARADKAQAAKAQSEKAQADKAQAAKDQSEKAQADRAQSEKAQADKAQAEKARAEKAQADRAQAEKAQAEKAQAEKAQAEKAQAAKAQAGRAQAEKAQSEQARAAKAQAEKAQSEQARAAKAQAEKAQSEQARAAKTQAEKAQAEKARGENARDEQTRGQTHQAAGPEARPAARPNQAGPTAPPSPSAGASRPAPAGGAREQGSSTPPSAGAAPRGHEPAAGHPAPHSGAAQKDADKLER